MMDIMEEHWFSKYLDLCADGPEHAELRKRLWTGGQDLVCGYYLSMLTRQNSLALPCIELRNEIRQYVIQQSKGVSVPFLAEAGYVSHFAEPMLKLDFSATFGVKLDLNKQERGLMLLLSHPDWVDTRIRQAVSTTEKQMARWSTYRLARLIQSRYAAGASLATLE